MQYWPFLVHARPEAGQPLPARCSRMLMFIGSPAWIGC